MGTHRGSTTAATSRIDVGWVDRFRRERRILVSPRIEFLLITNHVLREKDEMEYKNIKSAVGKRASHLRFSDIHTALRENVGKKEIISTMVTEYLDDIGATYRDDVDPKALKYAIQKMANWSNIKAVNKTIAQSTPSVFEIIMRNLDFLGNWVRDANKGLFPQQFKSQFYVRPYYDVLKIYDRIKDLEIDSGTEIKNAR